MIRNRMSAAIMALMALYIFFNFIWFPKKRQMEMNGSGVHTVKGGNNRDDVWDLGKDKEGNVVRAKHGDDDDVCFHYDGILLISYADEDGFATVFFFYILNQLLYAERHNLLPWIHLDGPTNKHVYDAKEHGRGSSSLQLGVTVLNGLEWESFHDESNGQTYNYPGTPILDYREEQSSTSEVTIDGSGIWSSYFEPPSRLDPLRHLVDYEDSGGDSTCHLKPIFQLTLNQIEPSLMLYSPWAVRAWRRKSTPPSLAQWNQPYQEWFDPMRRTAHEVVRQHFHPTVEMTELAHDANLVVASEESCLALHIRHSDKADRREQIGLDEFRPYVEAYQQAALWVGGTTMVIYVATDSNQVLKQINAEWPNTITSYMHYQTGDIVRSDNQTAVFAMTQSHHKTNTEVFVDILAMAECEFMVHGMSAVTEAVHYLNLRLHNQSVNLEEETMGAGKYIHQRKATMSPQKFETLVRTRLNEKQKERNAKKKEMDNG